MRPAPPPLQRPFESLSDYKNVPDHCRGAVIALGNFDGLHRGHQAVINQAKDIAAKQGAPVAIATFNPHPIRFFKPDSPPFRLMSSRQRENLLKDYGVDMLFEIPFDETLRDMSDEDFVQIVLHERFGARHIIVGEDFQFGKGRCGNIDSLKALGKARGIGVTGLKPVGLHDFYGKYGSTEIRKALTQGDVLHAAHMLSRPWSADGIVSKGAQRGRTIGFPTANIAFVRHVRPKYGVYAVELKIDGEDIWRAGVANTGKRPTVGGEQARIEVHIFDFDRDIYGQMVDIRFRSFIREEKKFDSFEQLKEQIIKDADGARAILAVPKQA